MNRSKEQIVRQIAHAEDEICSILSKYKLSLDFCPESGSKISISGKFLAQDRVIETYSEDTYLS